jgi:hypothetical protein
MMPIKIHSNLCRSSEGFSSVLTLETMPIPVYADTENHSETSEKTSSSGEQTLPRLQNSPRQAESDRSSDSVLLEGLLLPPPWKLCANALWLASSSCCTYASTVYGNSVVVIFNVCDRLCPIRCDESVEVSIILVQAVHGNYCSLWQHLVCSPKSIF